MKKKARITSRTPSGNSLYMKSCEKISIYYPFIHVTTISNQTWKFVDFSRTHSYCTFRIVKFQCIFNFVTCNWQYLLRVHVVVVFGIFVVNPVFVWFSFVNVYNRNSSKKLSFTQNPQVVERSSCTPVNTRSFDFICSLSFICSLPFICSLYFIWSLSIYIYSPLKRS